MLKSKKKLWVSFLSIFILFGTILQSNLFAYNLTYNVGANFDDDGNLANYTYRMYTTASIQSKQSFNNDTAAYRSEGKKLPYWFSGGATESSLNPTVFETDSTIFHRNKIGNYDSLTLTNTQQTAEESAESKTYYGYANGIVTYNLNETNPATSPATLGEQKFTKIDTMGANPDRNDLADGVIIYRISPVVHKRYTLLNDDYSQWNR